MCHVAVRMARLEVLQESLHPRDLTIGSLT